MIRFKSKPARYLRQKTLPLLLGSALLSPLAQAVTFGSGDFEGSFTSEFSVGSSWRIQDQASYLKSVGNGGSAPSNTTDDGNLNFEKGDQFSTVFKGMHSLSLRYNNFGGFFRVKYWYDTELKDENHAHGHIANNYQRNAQLNDDNFSDFAKFSGIELMDAYVFAEFNAGSMPIDVRLGRQVLSWGESTFIQGGLNIINPFDVSAFRRPGAEVKEGLIPVEMLSVNFGLSDNLSLEAFYQLKWAKTELEGCGTYFSTTDYAAEGCNALAFAATVPDSAFAATLPLQRSADEEPDDDGQFGFAMRYLAESIDTEFGLYFINYHSRNPLVNATRSSATRSVTLPPFLGGATIPNAAAAHPLLQTVLAGRLPPALAGLASQLVSPGFNAKYNTAFPEDIQVYGLSFATNVDEWAVSGEWSYRPELPVQVNGNDLLAAGLLNDALAILPGQSGSPLLAGVGLGESSQGWRPFEVSQAQMTFLRFFDQVMGASRLSLVAEVGATYVHDFNTEFNYGRNTNFGTKDQGGTGGYMTKSSWGYRVRAGLEYPNLLGGVTVKPGISFLHDVRGNSPSPGQQFMEGRKNLGLSMNFEYLSRYTLGISMTRYMGSENTFNPLEDRDFASLTASASF